MFFLSFKQIHNTLLWYTGTFKNNFDSRWKNFKMIKKAMGDKVSKNDTPFQL